MKNKKTMTKTKRKINVYAFSRILRFLTDNHLHLRCAKLRKATAPDKAIRRTPTIPLPPNKNFNNIKTPRTEAI